MTLEGRYVPSSSAWVAEQVAEYEASGGTRANTLRDTGIPVVIITMRGLSGLIRKIALMRVEHEGEYALVGSKGGAPDDPLWVANIRANPHVQIQDGPQPLDFAVREVTGAEYDEWWERGVAVFPPYADYMAKTDRVIPILVASRL